MFQTLSEPPPLDPNTKALLVLSSVLLVPWCVIAPFAGMAFDGGADAAAWIVVVDVWTYPLTLAMAFFYRRRHPRLAYLPIIHGLPFGVAMAASLVKTVVNLSSSR
jgi:hypothetical protein